MKQNYFDDKLKNLLENGEEHPFEEGEWRRLDRRLRAVDQPQAARWLRWLPVAFLLLLCGSLWQHYLLSGKISQLERTLVSDQLVRSDTLRKTVIIYDTLFREVTREVWRAEVVAPQRKGDRNGAYLPSLGARMDQLLVKLPDFTASAYPSAGRFGVASGTGRMAAFSDGPPAGRPFLIAGERGPAVSQSDPNRAAGEGGKREEMAIPTIAAGQLYYLRVSSPALTVSAPAFAPLPRPKPSLLLRLRPRSYSLEGYVGGLRETTFLKNDDGFQAGLGLALGITDRLGLSVGLNYLNRTFRLDEDQLSNYPFPTVNPQNPDDEVESGSGNLRQGQLPVGIRYELLRTGDWNFYAEGGVAATFGLPSILEYTLEDDLDRAYTRSVNNVLERSLGIRAYYGTLGVRYRASDKWSIMLAATRQQAFTTSLPEYDQPEFLGYRFGARYRL